MGKLETWAADLVLSLREIVGGLLSYLPVVFAAAALLVIGWFAARLGRHVVARLVSGLDWVVGRATARSAEQAERLQSTTARAVSSVTFWAILLIFVAAAARTLGSSIVDQWAVALLGYLPTLIGGILIIVLGFVAGTAARYIVESSAGGLGIAHSTLIGRMTQVAIVVTGLLIGLSQVGINVTFLVQILTVAVAAALGAIALTLALATREQVANVVGAHYARKHINIGDRIRIGDIEGRIADVSDGYLFLETEQGDIALPATHFTRNAVTILPEGE